MVAKKPKRSPGRPLTPAQKQARKLAKAHPEWSAEKIASLCGLTRDAVQRDAAYTGPKQVASAKVAKAAALVDSGEANQREAAREMGVHESAISKFRTRQKQKMEMENGKNG